MSNFGPAFSSAIIAAGLGGLPFGWDDKGNISGLKNLTAAQQATLQGIVATFAAQEPPSPLVAFAGNLQQQIASGGITVNVGTAQAPVNVPASTDATSLIWLQGAYTMAQANAKATFNWNHNGVSYALTAADVVTIFSAVTNFLQSTQDTLSAVIAAINAGTITTRAQVASPPAPSPAWPSNS